MTDPLSDYLPGYLPDLARGALVTIELTAAAALVGLVLALAAGIGMVSTHPPVRAISRTYTELFRGMPAIVLMFWFVYSLPFLGLRLSPFVGAAIALGLNIGAYEAEVVRGSIQAVPREQKEAAIALNMPAITRMGRVVLPQAAVTMVPPLSGLTVQLLKATALASLIGLQDLTFAGDVVNNNLNRPLEIFSFVLVGYFLIALAITRSLGRLERRLGRWRRVEERIARG